MDIWENRYWPFKTLPTDEQSELHQREIRFLENTFEAGFKPYMFGSENFAATSGSRGGEIVFRGSRGKHWGLLLGTTQETILSAHVDDFDCAAGAVLRWLRGGEPVGIAEPLRGHLLPWSFVLRDSNTDPVRAGEVVWRSVRHWDVCLLVANEPILTAHVDDFECAVDALRHWLDKQAVADILESLRSHLFTKRGTMPGFVLYSHNNPSVSAPSGVHDAGPPGSVATLTSTAHDGHPARH